MPQRSAPDGAAADSVPTGISHFAIKVRDLSAAERFYCGVLGLSVERRWPWPRGASGDLGDVGDGAPNRGAPPTAGYRSLWLRTGDDAGTFLALEAIPDHEAAPSTGDTRGATMTAGREAASGGHHLLALRITRAQRGVFEARLSAAGVAISNRTAFSIYFDDPEGNRLGLSHYPDAAADDAADDGAQGAPPGGQPPASATRPPVRS